LINRNFLAQFLLLFDMKNSNGFLHIPKLGRQTKRRVSFSLFLQDKNQKHSNG